MTAYFTVRCDTCDETHQACVATSEGEILHPVFDEGMIESLGEMGTESFQRFHERHNGHSLRAVEVSVQAVK